MKFLLLISLLTSMNIDSAKGVVDISPSEVAPVLYARWEITVMTPEIMTSTLTVISSIGPSGIIQPVRINNSTFTASRLSCPDSLPLMSRMTVNPVSSGLNRAVVKCYEGISSTESVATTTIQIVDPEQFGLSIKSRSEDFSSDGVTVNLEWTLLNSQISYQYFLRNVSVNAVPPLRNMMFAGSMRVQLVLLYNTLYNVSVTQHSTCEQLIRTIFFELNYYSKCSDPMELTNAISVGYDDLALEGQNISFACAPEQVLNGSKSSTCMGNEECEPDPGEVDCTDLSVTIVTGTTMLANCSSPLYVLQMSVSVTVIRESSGQEVDDTDTCCSSEFLITGPNTKTCLENGEWELGTSQTNCDCEEVSATVLMLRTTLVSVTCVLVVMSVFIFIIGFVCGHYFSQRWRESANNSKQ